MEKLSDNSKEVVNNKSIENSQYVAKNETKEMTENEGNKEELRSVSEESTEVVSSAEDEGQIGEAVMVSSNSAVNYFYNVKLDREQTRAKNKEELIEIVENTEISEAKKEEAISKMVELTANAERENAAEMMLKARGFEETVVSIVDGKADVIVDVETITEEQVAQIVDIVNRKTGIENKNIVVTPTKANKTK
jgi:stage III sporulation protein AH